MEPLGFVVLIDDSANDNFLCRRRLERDGMAKRVEEFQYAEAALAFLDSSERPQVNLILVDFNMPRMDGLAFADAYEQLDPPLEATTMPLILTGSLDPEHRERAAQHSAIDGFISTPPDLDTLEALIESAAKCGDTDHQEHE